MNIILLYKRLLEISEKEENEIGNKRFDLDKIEEYSSLKEDIIKRLDALNNSEWSNLSYSQDNEIEDLIRKILVLNDKNRKDIINLQNKIMSEISTIQIGKRAHQAYISNQYPTKSQ